MSCAKGIFAAVSGRARTGARAARPRKLNMLTSLDYAAVWGAALLRVIEHGHQLTQVDNCSTKLQEIPRYCRREQPSARLSARAMHMYARRRSLPDGCKARAGCHKSEEIRVRHDYITGPTATSEFAPAPAFSSRRPRRQRSRHRRRAFWRRSARRPDPYDCAPCFSSSLQRPLLLSFYSCSVCRRSGAPSWLSTNHPMFTRWAWRSSPLVR